MIARKSGGGVIVNVNSGSGKVGFENFSSYCASKFGLVGLAESTALEVVRSWTSSNKNVARYKLQSL
jgi:NAD(P)-dependent dehydrogenase (short-subunit alcohol dehydrogenase family)